MKTYRCDKCGSEWWSDKGIVGNEYDYHNKFETLNQAYRQEGIIDVCSKCYKELQDVILGREQEERRTRLERAKEWLLP